MNPYYVWRLLNTDLPQEYYPKKEIQNRRLTQKGNWGRLTTEACCWGFDGIKHKHISANKHAMDIEYLLSG